MAYQCYAYTNPVFGPAMRIIASITNAENPVVTTTFDHGYVDGTVIRFIIPPSLGMVQLDKQTSPIIVTGSTTFSINIDTSQYAPFVIPVGLSDKIDICGLSIAIGSKNDTLKPAEVNIL